MTVCTGRGDNGGHCCWIDGKECEFLEYVDDRVWCGLWDLDMRKSSRWRNAPVGQYFKDNHPGFDCKDWPQNIPNPETLGGLCCWKGKL